MQKKSYICLVSTLALSTAAIAIYSVSKCSCKNKLVDGLADAKNKICDKIKPHKIIPCNEKYVWKAEDSSF